MVVVALDLHRHEAVVEHSDGPRVAIALIPDRPVAAVTREVLATVRDLAGKFAFDPRPQETPWSTPLDEDEEHATFDPTHVRMYFAAAAHAAGVLARLRAPFRGRSTPVNAWWGSFDLATNLFSGQRADPPSQDFISRNAMNVQEVAVGWWPGDERYPNAAFYAYAHPKPSGYESADLQPGAARWNGALGEFILDWDDVCAADDPRRAAWEFVSSAVWHSCTVCSWDPSLITSLKSDPPPIV
jgi:hypothetical protein